MNFPTARDVPPNQSPGTEEELFNLRTAVAVVLDSWPIALGIFFAGIALGVFNVWVTPWQYESSALIEIESRSSGFAVGPENFSGYPYWDMESTAAQIEILKSRSILGAAAEELGLTISAEPIHLGLIGAAMARRYGGEGVASDPWYIPFSAQYSWGGERIDVPMLKLSGPYTGVALTLIAGEDGSYSLIDHRKAEIGKGKVGEEMTFANGDIGVRVAALEARPGTKFTLQRLPVKIAADMLRARMRIVERGAKGAFSSTGILEVTVKAGSPQEASDSANAVANTYLRQNIERLSQGAERKLEFLNQQLPRLQAELEGAEQSLLEQRSKSGPYQLSEGAKSILDSLVILEREISELELQRTDLAQTLTAEHPALSAVMRKLEKLEAERARLNTRIAGLPDAESRLLQLMRNSKVASELYIALLNKAQELKIAKAGTIGNVRIVDSAVPVGAPVEPRVQRTLLSGAALGLIIGLAAVFLRKHLNVKLDWAEDAERRIGVPVYATIPFSRKQLELDGQESTGLLAQTDPKDIAVESLRSLRASLHFAMMDAKRNLVVITGSTPNVGKSFVAANLARLVADSGRKVLLIDADMRKGRMNKIFGLERSPGLSEVIAGKVPFKEACHALGEHFFLVTTGKLPPNPAELLASEHFVRLVEDTCKEFELVIVDTPPILNLADTVVIARSAGALFVTIRGGVSTVPDVLDCVQRFGKNGIKVDGLIFNGLRPGFGSYVHPQYYHYRYRYSRYGSAKT